MALFQGKPMIFIGQIEPTQNEIVAHNISPETVLYIFGAREYIENSSGFRTHYRVVSQNRSWKRGGFNQS